MTEHLGRWWCGALCAGATTALLVLLSGCGHSATSTSGAAPTAPSMTPSVPTPPHCRSLPAGDVPGTDHGLTQADRGDFCVGGPTSVLVVLKADGFTQSAAWARPTVTGPDGGVSWMSPPLTPLRGTTTAAVALTLPGDYAFSSTTGDGRTWSAHVHVGG